MAGGGDDPFAPRLPCGVLDEETLHLLHEEQAGGRPQENHHKIYNITPTKYTSETTPTSVHRQSILLLIGRNSTPDSRFNVSKKTLDLMCTQAAGAYKRGVVIPRSHLGWPAPWTGEKGHEAQPDVDAPAPKKMSLQKNKHCVLKYPPKHPGHTVAWAVKKK